MDNNFYNMGMPSYNMMYNRQPFRNQTDTTVKGNTIWVQGYEGANAFRMEPNSLFVLLDNNLERIYIKSTDNIGMCNGLRRFKLIEEKDEAPTPQEKTNLNEYVRKDELQDLLMSIIPQPAVAKEEMKEVKADVPEQQLPTVRKTVYATSTK